MNLNKFQESYKQVITESADEKELMNYIRSIVEEVINEKKYRNSDISNDISSSFYAIETKLKDLVKYYNDAYEQEEDPKLKNLLSKRYGNLIKSINR